MDDSLRELYQDVILDHSRHPRHFGVLEGATHSAEGHNPLCGDRVKLSLVLDDADRVMDIKFEGKGCAISQASASLMTEMVMGRSRIEAEKLMEGFLHLVKGEDAGALNTDDRERLDILAGISAFPMRVKCATLAWHTFKSAVEEGKSAVEEGKSAKEGAA